MARVARVGDGGDAAGSRQGGPVGETASASPGAGWSRIATAALGGLLGGLFGGAVVVGVTLVLKAGMDFVSSLDTWLLILVPLLGLALTVLVLQVYGRTEGAPVDTGSSGGGPRRAWR